jgi:NifU-like protein involved in Fe-S cluster formation
MYSNKVRQLINDLPNRGRLASATHAGEATNPVCGDIVRLELRLDGDRVLEASFEAEGCPAALAAAAGLTEMVSGLDLGGCSTLRNENLLEYLDGLPSHKKHGADLAIDCLMKALSSPVSSG